MKDKIRPLLTVGLINYYPFPIPNFDIENNFRLHLQDGLAQSQGFISS